MNIESKIWTWTNAGTKKHAFIDGVALCRKSITRAPGDVARHGMDYCAAKNASICVNCEAKFNAAIERAEASTGAGDYLPPAVEQAKETVNMQSKIWDTARTGNTVHAFNEEGKALCRSSITLYHLTNGLGDRRVSWAEASAWVLRTPGLKFCASCERKFEAAAETVEILAAPAPKPLTQEDVDAMFAVTETVEAPVAQVTTTVKATVTPEVIEALHLLRTVSYSEAIMDAINCLDNAGIFAAIDEATGYDLDSKCTCPRSSLAHQCGVHRPGCPEDPQPERVSKCTCDLSPLFQNHRPGCPGDPAEWGDMAYTLVPKCPCGGSGTADGKGHHKGGAKCPLFTAGEPSAADNIRRAVGLKFE